MSNLVNDPSNKKARLGRGLGSLLGENKNESVFEQKPKPAPHPVAQPAATKSAAPTVNEELKANPAPAIDPESKVWKLAVDKLQPSAFQPRTTFEKVALEELSQSIKASGMIQPITVRRLDAQKFEIIAGERRWRAAQMAGLHEVPVLIKTLTNKEALEIAIVENVQREDLNPIEEAEAYSRLMAEFSLTQQQTAERVGKERATVANSLRLLQLGAEVRQMLLKNELSAGHAKVLLSLENPKDQLAFAKKAVDQKMSVRQLEKLVKNKGQAEPAVRSTFDSNITDRLISGLSDELQKLLGTKVQIDYKNSKGKISIQFYSDEELTQLVERLKEGCQN